MKPLYVTDSDHPLGAGIPVTTQSMIKSWNLCKREVFYKFILQLSPKVASKPLERGKWFHALLEAYYQDQDWELVHRQHVSKFRKLFDEEKEALGDLPTELDQLMRSYLWHYAKDQGWEVIAVEVTVEAMLPNGHLFRGRVDMIIRDREGRLWVIDHKTHKKMPDWSMRMLDEQSPLYIWALREMGHEVDGFIWNYVITKGISVPRVLKNGKRFYANDGESDYPTYAKAVKQALADYPGTFLKDPDDKAVVRAELARLKGLRYDPDAPQTSSYFRRDLIVKADDMIDRVLASAVRSSEEMHNYDFSDVDAVPRNVNACKGFMCNYQSLTLGDLVTGDSSMAQAREYKRRDPLEYYGDNEKGS